MPVDGTFGHYGSATHVLAAVVAETFVSPAQGSGGTSASSQPLLPGPDPSGISMQDLVLCSLAADPRLKRRKKWDSCDSCSAPAEKKSGGSFAARSAPSTSRVVSGKATRSRPIPNNGRSPWTRTPKAHRPLQHHLHADAGPYVNKDGFQFTIYRTGIFSGLGKWLGMQDVDVGYPEFDEAFVIKGNDEAKLRALFANPRIRQLIEIEPDIHLTVQGDEGWFGTQFPQGVDELYFSVPRVIKDVEELKSLYCLFAEVLHHLCHIGSAYENDPQLEHVSPFPGISPRDFTTLLFSFYGRPIAAGT